jgi:hypothetical protein
LTPDSSVTQDFEQHILQVSTQKLVVGRCRASVARKGTLRAAASCVQARFHLQGCLHGLTLPAPPLLPVLWWLLPPLPLPLTTVVGSSVDLGTAFVLLTLRVALLLLLHCWSGTVIIVLRRDKGTLHRC